MANDTKYKWNFICTDEILNNLSDLPFDNTDNVAAMERKMKQHFFLTKVNFVTDARNIQGVLEIFMYIFFGL